MAVNAYLSPWLRAGFLDNNGNPLANGQLYSFVAGSSTPAATYTDATATQPNPNPITLNSRGEAPNGVWLIPGVAYKFTLADSTSATIWTVDQVFAQPQYQSGSFTATGLGFSGTPPTFTVNYTVMQNAAVVAISPNSGTSNTNYFQLSGIPSILQPPTLQQMVSIPFVLDNGTISSNAGIIVLNGSTSWQVFKANNISAWTTSGSKGFLSPYGLSFSYLLV